MEVAGVLPPPMEKNGRGPKGAQAATSARKADEDEDDDELDSKDSDAPLLMGDSEDTDADAELDEIHPDSEPGRNPPEIDPAA
jgi:hypothetical protein